jgi:hypothetical protein
MKITYLSQLRYEYDIHKMYLCRIVNRMKIFMPNNRADMITTKVFETQPLLLEQKSKGTYKDK